MQYGSWNRLLRGYWREHQPDLVVSLLPLVNRVLCDSLRAECPDTPFVTAMTDFADCPPHFWIEPQVQWLICPSERAMIQAQTAGYAPERLMRTSGVVIHPRFCELDWLDRDRSEEFDYASERQQLGLDPDRPTGLVIFGSYGAPEMLDIARRLERSFLDLQLILICGHNQPLAERLRRMNSRFPMVVEGFTKQLPHYMRLSDFFIGKPGSVGISEALALGLPVITECNRLTLFQERPSAEWLVEQELGIVVDRFSEIDRAVAELLQPETFSRYRANVAAYRNRAVFEVVNCLETILDHSVSKSVQAPLVA
jgi:1,2-diacylglycerol 3-beta-galactosyltransferase